MKTKMFFSFIIFCLITTTVFAEKDEMASDEPVPEETTNFSLTIYPFPAVVGWYSAECEVGLIDHFSIALESIYLYSNETENGKDLKYRRLQIGPGVRFYHRETRNGAFIGLYADYLRLKVYYRDPVLNEKGKGVGDGYVVAGWIGYKWIINNIVLEASTGYEYVRTKKVYVTMTDSYGNTYDKNYTSQAGISGWTGIGLGVGIAF